MKRDLSTRSNPDPSVLCAHAGIGLADGDPLVTPLVQSTTFCRDGVGSQAVHQYSRVSNPTVAQLEKALGDLEGAPPAVTFNTGLGAETALFLAVLKAGDHVVCGRSVYGGTTRLLQDVLSPLGVETTFVDSSVPGEVERAVRETTRLVVVESPSNPRLELTDIGACAEAAHRVGALLAVDNTFQTPVLQRPLDLGADITVTSTTKFVDGHSVATGGSIVSRDAALIERVRFIRKSTGGIQSPFGAWLTLLGLKTLPLRLARQSETCARLAAFLDERPELSRVFHPSLATGEQRVLAERQHLDGRDGAVVTIELAGGLPAARVFLESLELCRLVEHIGSVETLVTHPATMTHADLTPEQRAAAGIPEGLIRISVGLEDLGSIADDIGRALEAVGTGEGIEAEGSPCLAGA